MFFIPRGAAPSTTAPTTRRKLSSTPKAIASSGAGYRRRAPKPNSAPPLGPKREIEFHLFLDASVAELICNSKHAVTTRYYRKPDGPLRIRVSDNDRLALTSLAAWQLRPISPDRLTT